MSRTGYQTETATNLRAAWRGMAPIPSRAELENAIRLATESDSRRPTDADVDAIADMLDDLCEVAS